MKKCRLLWVLLMLVLLVSACTKKETHNIAGKTYYSTTVESDLKPSQVWFGSDKSFVMTNYFSDGVNELSGKWSIKENVITLDVEKSSTGDDSKVLFEINDDHNIILKSNVIGAIFDQLYKDSKPEVIDNTVKVEYKKYYNVSQNTKNKSFLDLKNDNSFMLTDQNDFGIMEYTGTYSIENDMVVVKYNDNANDKTVKFLIKEDKTLVLQDVVGVSVTGDVFDSNYSENSSNNNSNTNTNAGNIACTEIKTLYNNYWAYKGVKNYNLEVTLVPSNATDTVTYTSDDKSIVEVDQNGNCNAVGIGKTKIHIKCGNIEKTVNFETKEKSTGVTEIKLNKDKMVLMISGREPIGATALPETADDKTLTYTSSDTNVVRIVDGEIEGWSPGVAQVIIKAKSGVEAVIDVCVEGAQLVAEFPENQSLKGGSGEIIYFEVYKLKCDDWNITKQDLRLYAPAVVSDPSLLSIDNKGRAIADGNTVSETKEVSVYFVWDDEDFPVEVYTQKYYVKITP